MIRCNICKNIITKYRQDLGDTIILDVPDIESLGTYEFIICDNCAKEIAKQLIER